MSLTSSVISFALLSVTGEPTSIYVDLYEKTIRRRLHRFLHANSKK
jgi:hypothetical protein